MMFRRWALVLTLGVVIAGEAGMVFVPGGKFQRGRTHEDKDAELAFYPNPLKDDLPVREIEVSPYYLDEHEVTVAEYAAFVRAKKHRPPPVWRDGKPPVGREQIPVADVSWEDAAAYCSWRGKRLPSEAEWERACRGITEKQKYPWGDRAPTAKDARFNGLEGPLEVCKLPRSSLGLCDIVGNLWEWTADYYGREYYAEAAAKDPKGPEKGMYRVLRGGSWFDGPNFLTCAHRSWARAGERSPNIGFRCAVSFGSRK